MLNVFHLQTKIESNNQQKFLIAEYMYLSLLYEIYSTCKMKYSKNPMKSPDIPFLRSRSELKYLLPLNLLQDYIHVHQMEMF